jgi:hypothetical protein
MGVTYDVFRVGRHTWSEPINAALAKDFASIPQVVCVLVQQDGNTVTVWLGLDDTSQEVRHRVYDKELAVIDAFPASEFDFNLIPTLGRPVESLISEPVTVAFSR